jgi:hypothetical protein
MKSAHLVALAVCMAMAADANAQTADNDKPVATGPATTMDADKRQDDIKWLASASSGLMIQSDQSAQPFFAAGVSRKIGRGYIRLSGTSYRSTFRQVDAILPCRVSKSARFRAEELSGIGSSTPMPRTASKLWRRDNPARRAAKSDRNGKRGLWRRNLRREVHIVGASLVADAEREPAGNASITASRSTMKLGRRR